MKNLCEIVKDLLPLYHDDVCSNESRSMVEKHLLECNDCKKYLDSMNNDFIQSNIEKATEQAKFDRLKGLKKKLFRKTMMISAVSVLCAIVVFLAGFSLIFHYEIPILYEDELLSVDIADDGVINILFNSKDYHCIYTYTKTIEKNGIEQDVVFVYYTDSIWTKYFSKPHKNEVKQFSIGNNIMVDSDKNGESILSKEDITAVYYLIGDYKNLAQMSNEEFTKATQDAILIWKKCTVL
ncbi:zf-HC2 domain-containing protein [Maledivibacter halophilus]|uniref:Putative zinc-finger n=1 Tax=Maledivibacter halophilus TaxID=36842 RepID=A0A1T5L021_9FIRM|nr:zf-HC2 domain-containing protein [Maledivibacter halophilus]SKC69386.1 Putative zinc-finger [Maledivibacter halophilus]